ncbi:F-box protein PP2-A15-like isoform X2 [Phoenix dactylifera]|uniref:F-box protein PP2-A15-like isoform X2 n=1 Tax=Phoenix dactylifera TaxID=42345 RepID=A0A8B8ZZJ2_PHODC|nr:F-box protein PP2-A15-like isoform X2 [Phoenix dactylifera]
MGAGVSSIMGPEGDGGGHETGLGDLPESCVAAVLLHLDPPEICRLARLGRAFRGAASADFVWETKLPRNYRCLMGLVENEKSKKRHLSKKEIFARLCRPNPFDGGTKVLVGVWVSDFLVLREKVEALCFEKELERGLVLDFCH